MTTNLQDADESNKKVLALLNSEQLEGLKLSKFNGQVYQKSLNYYGFYQEFNDLVVQKPYTDSRKLRYLKQYLVADALHIIKSYPRLELPIVFKALDDVYG